MEQLSLQDSSTLLPTYDAFIPSVLEALRALGGSGTNAEINAKVAELAGLTDEQLALPHSTRRNISKADYRLHWARSYLKAYGLIDNSSRGVWVLTPSGREAGPVDGKDVARAVRAMAKTRSEGEQLDEDAGDDAVLPGDEEPGDWRGQALDIIRNLPPDAFERLAQRLLRESGFVQVEVTGRSGDGGIDGRGILRLGLLSFHVSFQCKRYKDTVGPASVREFRGAIMGRADKGLIVTSGSFTKEAIREATRDGAAAIDLVDGEQLLDRLKELGLGVSTTMVERVTIDQDWFSSL